jgi:hypothetical protein
MSPPGDAAGRAVGAQKALWDKGFCCSAPVCERDTFVLGARDPFNNQIECRALLVHRTVIPDGASPAAGAARTDCTFDARSIARIWAEDAIAMRGQIQLPRATLLSRASVILWS